MCFVNYNITTRSNPKGSVVRSNHQKTQTPRMQTCCHPECWNWFLHVTVGYEDYLYLQGLYHSWTADRTVNWSGFWWAAHLNPIAPDHSYERRLLLRSAFTRYCHQLVGEAASWEYGIDFYTMAPVINYHCLWGPDGDSENDDIDVGGDTTEEEVHHFDLAGESTEEDNEVVWVRRSCRNKRNPNTFAPYLSRSDRLGSDTE